MIALLNIHLDALTKRDFLFSGKSERVMRRVWRTAFGFSSLPIFQGSLLVVFLPFMQIAARVNNGLKTVSINVQGMLAKRQIRDSAQIRARCGGLRVVCAVLSFYQGT